VAVRYDGAAKGPDRRNPQQTSRIPEAAAAFAHDQRQHVAASPSFMIEP
jgi:hypothetical protein